MKFSEWLDYDILPNDIIAGCTDPTGLDADNYIYPLGCHHNFNKFKENNNINIFTKHPEINTELLFYNFRASTDIHRKITESCRNLNKKAVLTRQDYKVNLDKRYQMKFFPKEEYFKNIGKYKFVISPSGNGLDCHRHYETWISKGIPIIEYNSFIEKKYSTLPILWTRDYSEINNDYLETQYHNFLDKKYDFRRLLLTHYKPKIQREIAIICAHHNSITQGHRTKSLWNFSDYFK